MPGKLSELLPADQVADEELRAIYDSCVEELEGDQGEVVLLREYAGATWVQIAKELGRSNTHAAEELYRRARVSLGTLLNRRLRSRS